MPTVMICDDYPDTCVLLSRLVCRLGVTPICYTSGMEAVAAARESAPSLALLDVTMPVMDGLETLAALRALPTWASVPIVMFIAVSNPQVETEALKLGAAEYWVRSGFDVGRLAELLGRYVPIRQDACRSAHVVPPGEAATR